MARLKIPADLAALIGKTETPFYYFDGAKLVHVAHRWRRAARLGAKVFYPYKCNRFPLVLDELAREGFGAEINIAADLPEALTRGIHQDRLLVQGPAKTPEVIDRTIAADGVLVVDSVADANAIFGRARTMGRRLRYLIRIRIAHARQGQRAFGMTPTEIAGFARESVRDRQPLPLGLAFHLGTGIPNFSPYRPAIVVAGELARVLRNSGAPVSVLDVGGGFSSAGETRFDDRGRPLPSRWTDPDGIVGDLLRETRRRLGDTDVWIEPGRALVAEAFHLVARVGRIRAGREAFLDASRMAHGFFVARGSHPVGMIPARRGKERSLTLAGPLGSDLDVFIRRIAMVPPREGDVVVFGNVGAYNLIAANGWAGPIPPVKIAGDAKKLTKRKEWERSSRSSRGRHPSSRG